MNAGLWKLPTETIKTPISIIKEQGSILTSAMRGLLVGNSTNMSHAGNVYINLSIIVPSLNNYKVDILQYVQPLAIYPGTFKDEINNRLTRIDTEQELLAQLSDLLGSDQMQRVLSSLYSQAAEAASS